jgi:hypothetical protein
VKPIDYRNATFAQLQERLVGLRLAVWRAWIQHGPGTTRAVARAADMSLLTFRPRTTELVQIGVVCLVDDPQPTTNDPQPALSNEQTLISRIHTNEEQPPKSNPCESVESVSHEGIYRARTFAEWQQWHETERAHATGRQGQLL